MTEIMRFKSHIDGKNADVVIHDDHIEWTHEGWLGTGAKLALASITVGTSLLKTGVSGKAKGTEVIPIKTISSVAAKRDGLRFWAVSVITTGNSIDFRCDRVVADEVCKTVLALINGSHPAQQSAAGAASFGVPTAPPMTAAPTPPPATAPSLTDKLRELGELHAAGVLDDAEFAAAKAKLLG